MFDIVTTSYVVNVSGEKIVSANTSRVALYLTASSGLNVYLGLSPQVLQGTATINFIGGTTYKLFWSQDGIMCQQAYYMWISAPGAVITVTELIFKPER